MKYLDWKLEEDKGNIRDGAIELRARVAENMYLKNYATPQKAKLHAEGPGFHWRISSVKKVELISGKKLAGKIVEIGAGTGVFSALLSKEKELHEIYCLDYDKFSVETLMPLVFKNLSANTDKINTVLGSYNNMKVTDNYFDYVVSLGAVHHSENLLATFTESYRVLKSGGFLVAVEHCHPNSYSVELQKQDDESHLSKERVKKLYNDENLKIKAKDNSDHNYRLCEFETYAYKAGFNVLPYVFDLNGEKANDSIFKTPKPFNTYSNRIFYPYYVKDLKKPVFDNFVLILQKPFEDRRSSTFLNTNLNKYNNKGFLSNIFGK